MAQLRTTAILNLKGGVAKTTTAVNMAAILASQHGKKVLLIDADSQCNTTEFMGITRKYLLNFSVLLREPVTMLTQQDLTGNYIHPSKYQDIDLIPADDSLMDLDLGAVKAGGAQVQSLRLVLNAVKDKYDFAIVDCPPAFNAACAAALVAADDVIIPIKLDAFSIRGMGNLMRQVRNMNKINPKLRLAGVLPTMWYKDTQVEEAEQLLKKSGMHIYHHIRATKKVDAMTWKQTPLSICSPHSAAAIDYKKFVTEYLGGKPNG